MFGVFDGWRCPSCKKSHVRSIRFTDVSRLAMFFENPSQIRWARILRFRLGCGPGYLCTANVLSFRSCVNLNVILKHSGTEGTEGCDSTRIRVKARQI